MEETRNAHSLGDALPWTAAGQPGAGAVTGAAWPGTLGSSCQGRPGTERGRGGPAEARVGAGTAVPR